MNRTDQAHSWVIYGVLVLVVLTICYAFLFTDKIDAAAFLGVATAIIMFFYGKPRPGGENGTQK